MFHIFKETVHDVLDFHRLEAVYLTGSGDQLLNFIRFFDLYSDFILADSELKSEELVLDGLFGCF